MMKRTRSIGITETLVVFFTGMFFSGLSVTGMPRLFGQEYSIESSLPMIRQSGDVGTLISVLSSAAYQHHSAGNSARALPLIKEAIELCRKTNNGQNLQSCLMIAGQILNKMDSGSAKKFLVDLLEGEAGNAETEAAVLDELGNQLANTGDLVSAIDVLGRLSRSRTKNHPGTMIEASALALYGRVCISGRLFPEGIAAYKNARRIAEQNGDSLSVTSYDYQLANAALNNGEYEVSKKILLSRVKECLATNDSTSLVSLLPNMAYALVNLDEADLAIEMLDQAEPKMSGVNRATVQTVRQFIAIVQGNTGDAIKYGEKAVDDKMAELPFAARMMAGYQMTMLDDLPLASLYLSQGDMKRATKAVDRADLGWKQTIKSMQKAADVGAVDMDTSLSAMSGLPMSIARIRQQVFLADGNVEQALVQSEVGRAQATKTAMRKNFGVKIDDAASNPTIDQITSIAKAHDVTIIEYSLGYPTDYMTRAPLSRDHQLARPKTLEIYVVKPDQTVVHRSVVLEQSLESIVDAARKEILDPVAETTDEDQADPKKNAPGATVGALDQLYQWLIQPIESELPTNPEQRLVIVPDESLFAVPFATLKNADGESLIERHTLVQSPSIETFRLSASKKTSFNEARSKDILVVGNPSMPMYRHHPNKAFAPLDPLPGAEAEAKAIASMFAVEALVGDSATETRVRERMSDASVIHLASHGLLEAENVFSQAYLSAIALAPSEKAKASYQLASGSQQDLDPSQASDRSMQRGSSGPSGEASLAVAEGENGFLTVKEIMSMNLSADLAVLSACDSGRGRITGDGVIGLSRAYLVAGVPNVIVSLWPVSDRATAVLMIHFYRALGEGKSQASALRQATLATRERFPAEKLWGAFTIYGAGK